VLTFDKGGEMEEGVGDRVLMRGREVGGKVGGDEGGGEREWTGGGINGSGIAAGSGGKLGWGRWTPTGWGGRLFSDGEWAPPSERGG